MTPTEFSDNFDVLYNNVTSNLAPGLDGFDKSVFLTQALEEIIRDFFEPLTNKLNIGFDGSSRRQMDFDNMIISCVYSRNDLEIDPIITSSTSTLASVTARPITGVNSENIVEKIKDQPLLPLDIPFGSSFLNYLTVPVDFKDIIYILNEWVRIRGRHTYSVKLVVPISFAEYQRTMVRPYKRPLKGQVWRINGTHFPHWPLNDGEDVATSTKANSVLLLSPGDTVLEYGIRFVMKPDPIITEQLLGATIDGSNLPSSGSLPDNLHWLVLKRAVELAKLSWMSGGELSQAGAALALAYGLGASGTEIGTQGK